MKSSLKNSVASGVRSQSPVEERLIMKGEETKHKIQSLRDSQVKDENKLIRSPRINKQSMLPKYSEIPFHDRLYKRPSSPVINDSRSQFSEVSGSPFVKSARKNSGLKRGIVPYIPQQLNADI
jgi:hypothetical protein